MNSALDVEADRPVITVLPTGLSAWAPPKPPDEAIAIAEEAVTTAFGVTRAELVGRSRPERIVRARQAWYTLILEVAAVCPHELASLIARNHGTIAAGVRATHARLDTIPQVRAMYAAARRHAGLTQ